MKAKNKIISIAMCLCLALLSGCTQESEGAPGAVSANTSAAENTGTESSTSAVSSESAPSDTSTAESESAETTPAADTGAAPGETTAAETSAAESESLSEDERFAYLDLLNAEFEKYGMLCPYGYSYATQNHFLCINNKIIFSPTYFNEDIMIYDAEKKEITGTAHGSAMGDFYVNYWLGYTFSYDEWSGNVTVSKYDSEGNLLNQLKEKGIERILPDGTLFGMADNIYYMYSPDWQTKTELPALKTEAEHGLKDTVTNYHIAAKYKNKLYVYTFFEEAAGFFCLDTDTMTWSPVESELNDANVLASGFPYNVVGRYLLIKKENSGTKVYDMETDTVTANIPSSKFEYDGRDYVLELKEGKLTKYRFPGDGSATVIETVLDTGDKDLNENPYWLVPVDEQYYVCKDEYGIFLREYGKGSEGEITVMLYEN